MKVKKRAKLNANKAALSRMRMFDALPARVRAALTVLERDYAVKPLYELYRQAGYSEADLLKEIEDRYA